MKLVVVGSRSFNSFEFLKKILQFHPCTQIISGECKGSDLLAKKYAIENGITYKEFAADWDNLGAKAGYIKNAQMVEAADEVIVFCTNKAELDDTRLKNIIELSEQQTKPTYKYWSAPDFAEGIGVGGVSLPQKL